MPKDHASKRGPMPTATVRRGPRGLTIALVLALSACAAPTPSPASEEVRMPSSSGSESLVDAARSDDPATLIELLARGGDANARNRDGEPLLLVAQLAGQWDNVQLLVERGADINAHPEGRPGDTVLAFYSAGQFDKVHWLLEHGADPSYTIQSAAAAARVGSQPIVENIYWWPVQAGQFPALAQWQRKSQDLLAAQGITAPEQPAHLRKLYDAQQNRGAAGHEAESLDQAIGDAERRIRESLD